VPGFNWAKLNSPLLSDSTVRENPLPGSVIVTLAPTTAAPEGSLTVPDKLPTFCAQVHVTAKRNAKEEIRMPRLIKSHLIDHSFRAPRPIFEMYAGGQHQADTFTVRRFAGS
jgi:hypothetical protein